MIDLKKLATIGGAVAAGVGGLAQARKSGGSQVADSTPAALASQIGSPARQMGLNNTMAPRQQGLLPTMMAAGGFGAAAQRMPAGGAMGMPGMLGQQQTFGVPKQPAVPLRPVGSPNIRETLITKGADGKEHEFEHTGGTTLGKQGMEAAAARETLSSVGLPSAGSAPQGNPFASMGQPGRMGLPQTPQQLDKKFDRSMDKVGENMVKGSPFGDVLDKSAVGRFGEKLIGDVIGKVADKTSGSEIAQQAMESTGPQGELMSKLMEMSDANKDAMGAG